MHCIPAIHPAGQPSAVRKCFLHFLTLDTFFWRSKRKYLAKGETLLALSLNVFTADSLIVVLPLRVEYNLQLFKASVVKDESF